MTLSELKSLGFTPLTNQIAIGDEEVQFVRHSETGEQCTVIWKPVFSLRPHKHGEFGGDYSAADLLAHGWPPPEVEPEPEAAVQRSLF